MSRSLSAPTSDALHGSTTPYAWRAAHPCPMGVAASGRTEAAEGRRAHVSSRTDSRAPYCPRSWRRSRLLGRTPYVWPERRSRLLVRAPRACGDAFWTACDEAVLVGVAQLLDAESLLALRGTCARCRRCVDGMPATQRLLALVRDPVCAFPEMRIRAALRDGLRPLLEREWTGVDRQLACDGRTADHRTDPHLQAMAFYAGYYLCGHTAARLRERLETAHCSWWAWTAADAMLWIGAYMGHPASFVYDEDDRTLAVAADGALRASVMRVTARASTQCDGLHFAAIRRLAAWRSARCEDHRAQQWQQRVFDTLEAFAKDCSLAGVCATLELNPRIFDVLLRMLSTGAYRLGGWYPLAGDKGRVVEFLGAWLPDSPPVAALCRTYRLVHDDYIRCDPDANREDRSASGGRCH